MSLCDSRVGSASCLLFGKDDRLEDYPTAHSAPLDRVDRLYA